MDFADPHPDYWEDYTASFQQVKHDLIRHYLNGWFPKLTWSGRVLYVDTHAGRGRYQTGQSGSPLVALETLLNHRDKPRLLKQCEFVFLFIEQDPDNLAKLKTELVAFGQLPPQIKVYPTCGDAFAVLTDLVKKFPRLAPAFIFVDPYGFKIPTKLLKSILKAGRVELFINVMWRYIDMAMRQSPPPGSQLAQTLDLFFMGQEWRTEVSSEDVGERMEQAVTLLRTKLGAKWRTFLPLATGGNATHYLMLHLTQHDKGRDLMKDCIWKLSPGGELPLRRSEIGEPWLIHPQPDLTPLREWVRVQLLNGPVRWQQLEGLLRAERWKSSHLKTVLEEMRERGDVQPTLFTGRFCAKNDPLLSLPMAEV